MERKRFKSGRYEDAGIYRKRKYCSLTCFAQRPIALKADPTTSTAHYHSRKMVAHGPCESCGTPAASDVHHVNWNWRDNRRENLKRLCRGCHNLAHERRRFCSVCGKPQRGLGYCERHYQRFKKYGDPLMFKRNQHSPLVRLDG